MQAETHQFPKDILKQTQQARNEQIPSRSDRQTSDRGPRTISSKLGICPALSLGLLRAEALTRRVRFILTRPLRGAPPFDCQGVMAEVHRTSLAGPSDLFGHRSVHPPRPRDKKNLFDLFDFFFDYWKCNSIGVHSAASLSLEHAKST